MKLFKVGWLFAADTLTEERSRERRKKFKKN